MNENDQPLLERYERAVALLDALVKSVDGLLDAAKARSEIRWPLIRKAHEFLDEDLAWRNRR